VAVAALHEALLAAAASFGVLEARAAPRDEERYSPLYLALTGDAHEDDTVYPLAIELIYEGYLLHYRESRVASPGGGQSTRLLAGDYLYARGLRLIAGDGDVAAVDLLTSLMAACSHFRVEGMEFACDDDMWAFTVAGLAALREGCPLEVPAATFARVEAAIVAGHRDEVPRLLREGAAALRLRDARPLEGYLAGFKAQAA